MQDIEKIALLINLGSPESTKVKDIRKYLDEFLMDERVIDLAYWKRALIVKGIILNFRPKKSAKAYQSIWWEEGSPLIVISKRMQEKVQKHADIPVHLAMRYGNPSINSVLKEVHANYSGLKEILLIPLYPHYAMSSYETVVAKTIEELAKISHDIKLNIMPPFYDNKDYINLLAKSIEKYNPSSYDRVLFSYHGIPERHVKKSDPSGEHCLTVANCCEKNHPCHKFCYRHQTLSTTKFVASELNLEKNKYSTSYQSRLGNNPWLEPFTDKTLTLLPSQGVKKLLIICPAFVSDCLETLEEIALEGKEIFMQNGGEIFKVVPCLNDDEDWAKLMAKWINTFDPKLTKGAENIL